MLAVALVIGAERPPRKLEAAVASSGEPVPECDETPPDVSETEPIDGADPVTLAKS